MNDLRALCKELDALLNDIASTHPNLSKNGVKVINDLSDRARAALTEQPVGPTPIPASERLPCLEDCDAEGRCWFHSTGRAWCDWYLLKASSATDTETHWLPANALPTPEAKP